MRVVVLRIAGAFMIVSAAAHGAGGGPQVRAEMAAAGAPADLIAGVTAGWHFGTAAMAAFGIILLVAATRLRRGDRSGMVPALAVAACYLVFGFAAFLLSGFKPFFLMFVATGLLAGAPWIGLPRPAGTGGRA